MPALLERRGVGCTNPIAFAAGAVVVTVGVVEVGSGTFQEDAEVAVRDVRAVEAQFRARRRRRVAGWGGGGASERQRNPRDRVQLDRVRGYSGLAVVEVE